jgi:hypothetical protein
MSARAIHLRDEMPTGPTSPSQNSVSANKPVAVVATNIIIYSYEVETQMMLLVRCA